ncbi:hypothetical protein P154DRAFT_527270 [Amniculicola lignicola CBS 123094]|uniref:Mitochondrial phosphate carrier protein n=1 Tax=Amniculicola lignicola CBS 123094 TaxID=1392246 RepID=A0A6A5VYN1_9PLEO|nr:hypothetical protein P154DRAFT_527270 [Amniculicola lignicola CBS 123094]
MLITRSFSLTNFVVASSALGFQVFVLYPWHKQLDDDFKALKVEHLRVLAEVQKVSAKERREIRDKLNELNARRIWW